jgi:hypothetical protein
VLELGISIFFVAPEGEEEYPEGANASIELGVAGALWCEE